LIAPYLTKYSSIRDVEVTDANGETKAYDLYRADRYGELAQDPFLKAGDVVRVKAIQRAVSVTGEVKRPGTYQLLPGENLRELIECYAQGFTELANPGRLSLIRYTSEAGDTDILGQKLLFDYAKTQDLRLRNYDAVTIPATRDLLPCVYFEGAIGVGVNGEDPQAAKKQAYTFYPGESLSQAAQKLRPQFSAVSDLENAYVKRGNTRIAVNIANFLYKKDYSSDIPLEADDTVIIPFRQFFVTVSGAVKQPGRYPYVPDREWAYYANLAGGVDQDKNFNEALRITDFSGKPYGKERSIQPEDIIFVESNSFLYSFGKVSSILTTIISVAALVISLVKP
jgi:protein involved in polysaccharide export with SLBB domain